MKREMFGIRLTRLRVDRALSQKELADKCLLSQAWISHFECGRRLPSLPNFVAICRALNLNPAAINYLLDS